MQKTEPWKDGGRENEEGGVKGQEGDWAGHYDGDDDDDGDANKCDADEHNCNLDHVLKVILVAAEEGEKSWAGEDEHHLQGLGWLCQGAYGGTFHHHDLDDDYNDDYDWRRHTGEKIKSGAKMSVACKDKVQYVREQMVVRLWSQMMGVYSDVLISSFSI